MNARLNTPILVQAFDTEDLIERVADRVVERLGPLFDSKVELLVDGNRLAQLLKLSRPTVDRLRSSGTIPSVLIGTSRRYSPADVMNALSTTCSDRTERSIHGTRPSIDHTVDS